MHPITRILLSHYTIELKANWSSFSSEHSGVLHLGIDLREDIKAIHIMPGMAGYDEYMAAVDGVDDDVINAFDVRAEARLKEFENLAVDFVCDQIKRLERA